MKISRRPEMRFFVALAAFYAVFFLGRWGWMHVGRGVHLSTARAEYSHDEFVEMRLNTFDTLLRRAWGSEGPVVTVTRQGRWRPTRVRPPRFRLHGLSIRARAM